MPARNPDLHGNAPDKASVALLLVDVINDLEFPDGDVLLTHAEPMAARLAALKKRVKAAGAPAIYANDNFGRWQSDFATLVRHCTEDAVRGRSIATLARGTLPAGMHTAQWNRRAQDGRVAQPGIYFVEVQRLGERLTKRAVLIR